MIHARSKVWPLRTICGAKARLAPNGQIAHRNGETVATDEEEKTKLDCPTCVRVLEAIYKVAPPKETT